MTVTPRRALLALAAATPAAPSLREPQRKAPPPEDARRLCGDGQLSHQCRPGRRGGARHRGGGWARHRPSGDVADPAAVGALFDANEEDFRGVDVVISNAAIMNVAPFAQFEDAAFDRMIATNIKGSFNVLRQAAQRVRGGGRIATLASTSVKAKRATHGGYAATKATQKIFSPACCPRNLPDDASR